VAGILQFALGLNISDFSANAKKAEDFLENLAKSAKGHGGVFGEVAEKLSSVFSHVKNASNSASSGGFLGIASAMGSALAAVELMKGMFLTMEESAKSIAEHFIQAAEHGAQLYFQSARTQASIGSIVGLQEGAKAVGLSEDSPQNMLLKLQRALGGVSDEGQRTDMTFARLGLNMRELRKLAPEQQLMAVAEALHEINSPERTGYASNLFGRQGYSDMLQLVNQLDEFKRAQGESSGIGSLAAQTGQAFASARASWLGLKADMESFFMGAAKYMVVPFQEVLEALRSVPWQQIGETLGLALQPFVHAVQMLANMTELFTNPAHFVKRKMDEAQAAADDANAQAPADRTKATIWNAAGLALKGLFGIPLPSYGSTKIGQGNPNDEGPTPWMQPRNNPFEKMGFIFGGRSDAAADYLRRSAAGIEQIVTIMRSSRRTDTYGLAEHFRNAP
jgi:hypothetical protein